MILAEDEVDLGQDHAGIMLLADGTQPGTPLADVLPLADEVLLVESTGNRPDLLSVYGIAREIAALFDLPLSEQPGGRASGQLPDGRVAIEIEDYAGCPRYVGRLFEDVEIAPRRSGEGASAGGGDAPDLERRRRDELRDARTRQPAPCLRPLDPPRGDGSSCGAHARGNGSARSTGSTAI